MANGNNRVSVFQFLIKSQFYFGKNDFFRGLQKSQVLFAISIPNPGKSFLKQLAGYRYFCVFTNDVVVCNNKIKLFHIKTGARRRLSSYLNNGRLKTFYDLLYIHRPLITLI